MVIAQTTDPEPRWMRTLESAGSLADDLGVLGTWVGPRRGPDKRTHGQKEDYVLRRLLVAWREMERLRLPVEIHAEDEREGEPDFVLRWPNDSLGIEITEAGEENYQKWLTHLEQADPTEVESVPLEASTQRTAAEIEKAIRRKIEKYDRGAYRSPDACDLVVYDNTAWGGFLDATDVLHRIGRPERLLGRFREVHLVTGETVFLDVFLHAIRNVGRVDIAATYEIDFAAWVRDQVEHLRQTAPENVDFMHIAEELEQLARSERRALGSHIRNLILHLLKWEFQEDRRGQSWRASIDNARSEVFELLTEMPSLRRDIENQIEPRYDRIRKSAALQTELLLNRFPERCPYAAEQLMDPEFFPDPDENDDD